MTATKPKRKQKPKAGKVVRLEPTVWRFFEKKRHKDETVSALVRRLIGPPLSPDQEVKTYYILPEAKLVCETLEEARGAAVLHSVRMKRKDRIERPLVVRVVP